MAEGNGMWCKKCGTEISELAAFCPLCDNPDGESGHTPEEKRGTRIRIIAAVIVIVVLVAAFAVHHYYTHLTVAPQLTTPSSSLTISSVTDGVRLD